jgi:hypothetical protein
MDIAERNRVWQQKYMAENPLSSSNVKFYN